MRFLLVVSASLALALSTIPLMPTSVAAAAGTYWFHGQSTDQTDKAVGVANANSADESIRALLDRADHALMRAKRAGRDRVIAG